MYLNFKNLIDKYKVTIKGIIHFGAHKAEEIIIYNRITNNVLWIEANPNLYDHLLEKVSQFEGNKLILCAATDVECEEIEFNYSNDTQSSSILEYKDVKFLYPSSSEFIKTIKIKAKPFVTIAKENNINISQYNFINLDVQGAEKKVLVGFRDALYNIDYIYTEVNLLQLYKGGALLHELDKYLYEYGFVRVETKLLIKGWGDAFYIRPIKSSKRKYYFNYYSSYMLFYVYKPLRLGMFLAKKIFTK